MSDPISSKNESYYITLLRHGESTGNAEGYFQGQADFPLTERGKEQSRALAVYWNCQGLKFDAIISSPLARARQTAELLAEHLVGAQNSDQARVECIPEWQERDFGRISGLHREENEHPHWKFEQDKD